MSPLRTFFSLSMLPLCANALLASCSAYDVQSSPAQIAGESAISLPLRATGNEPSWILNVTSDSMSLETDLGATRTVTRAPAVTRVAEGAQFSAQVIETGAAMVATVSQRVCGDSMTGMPHPYTVAVRSGERMLRGCGGNPRALLAGHEWVVENIDGKGIIDRSRVTLNFAEAGQISGRASCNSYSGQYKLTGEGFTVVDPAVTMMACAPLLMQQEDRFLSTLRSVQRFEIAKDGALVLLTGDQGSITARR